MIPLQTTEFFNDAAWNLLLKLEKNSLYVYTDGHGIPTLGVGYALITRTKINGSYVYYARGATPQTANDYTKLSNELQRIIGDRPRLFANMPVY